MKTARFPLYAKVLLWFFLNLLVVAVVLLIIASERFSLGPELLAIGGAGDRLHSLAELISGQLERVPRREWDAELKRFGAQFSVEFLMFRANGEQLAGTPTDLPESVRQRLTERVGAGRGGPPPIDLPEDGPRDRRFEDRPPNGGGRPPFIIRSDRPRRYWIGVNARPPERPMERRGPAMLVIVSKDLRAGGLLFDFAPWLWTGAGILLFSIVFWIPLVRHITRPVAQMQAATAQIAEGNFETRVSEKRRDELGALGWSVNRMAARLSGLVRGQKRFLGDIAHELCTPLARMQMALGILDERVDEKSRSYVTDVREEVEHMSGLVNELLSFSKASLNASVRPQSVSLPAVIQRAIKREAPDDANVRAEVPDELTAIGDPELIVRAISNLIRNAIRYAGNAGPITISASERDEFVELIVADSGPGVPENELPKLFDPFYRVDTSRARETGGVGLGLSIVKTCIEACEGKVSCRNRAEGGFEVVLTLKAAPSTSPVTAPSA